MPNKWLKLWAREFHYMVTDRMMRRIFLVVPLFMAAIFAGIYYQGQVAHMSMVILDLDHSELSREIITGFELHDKLHVTAKVSRYSELEDKISQGKCQIGVVIPEDLETKASQGRSVRVLTIIDGSNLLFTNNALNACSEVITDLSATLGLKLLVRTGYLPEQALKTLGQISFTEEVWYNPGFNYAHFLVFPFIIFIFQQTFLIGGALSISREKGTAYWDELRSHMSGWIIVPGKIIPYMVIGLSQLFLILVIGKSWLGLPVHGSAFCLAVYSLLFYLVLSALSLLCSQLAKPLDAIRYTMFMALPSLVLSGYTWPLSAMPLFIRAISYCLPLTWYLEGFQAITIRGAGWQMISWHICVLVIMLLVCLIGNYLVWIKSEYIRERQITGLEVSNS